MPKSTLKKLVPFANPGFAPSSALMGKISKVLTGGIFSKGPHLDRFESRLAEFLCVGHAVAVSSCMSGLILTLKGLDITGEVIVPSFSFPAAPASIVGAGLTPVFVDCDPLTFNIDPEKTEQLISPKTRAIMPVASYGLPANIGELERIADKHGVQLVIDSAQGFGASYQGKRAGRFGTAEVMSFSQSKILPAGEGGLVTTNDHALAKEIKRLRNYGKSGSGEFLSTGLSARMSEIHSLIGLELLNSVPSFLKRRRDLVRLYKHKLGGIEGIGFQSEPEGVVSSNNFFPIFVNKKSFGLSRDSLHDALTRENIGAVKLFHPPAHTHRAFKDFPMGALKSTRKAANECLVLPLYPTLSEKKVRMICKAIERV